MNSKLRDPALSSPFSFDRAIAIESALAALRQPSSSVDSTTDLPLLNSSLTRMVLQAPQALLTLMAPNSSTVA